MASRSRVVQYLAVAALLTVALLSGCSTGRQPAFRYPARMETPPDKESPAHVEINSECNVSPEKAVVSVGLFNRRNPRSQVLWHATDKQERDRVVISAKEGDAQNRTLFGPVYDMPASYAAVLSGSPTGINRVIFHLEKQLIWRYRVDYYRDGKLRCTRDPEICIQKPGTNGCGTSG